MVEYDRERLQVRRAQEGWVLAPSRFRRLYRDVPLPDDEGHCSRYRTLPGLVRAHCGRIDRAMNLAAAPGVPIRGINLQLALLFSRRPQLPCLHGEGPGL